jgi:hypothetical protein
MAKALISYLDMCCREGARLRCGMHFQLGGHHPALLMSIQPHASYWDYLIDDGVPLIYERRDEPMSAALPFLSYAVEMLTHNITLYVIMSKNPRINSANRRSR